MPGVLAGGPRWEAFDTDGPRDLERLPIADLLAFAATHTPMHRVAIKRRFGISQVRYAQQLNRALDDPEAAALEPELVARLRAERDERRARRQLFTRCGVCGHEVGSPWNAGEPVTCKRCGARNYTMGRNEA